MEKNFKNIRHKRQRECEDCGRGIDRWETLEWGGKHFCLICAASRLEARRKKFLERRQG